MIDILIDGVKYRLVKNKRLFACVNVLFYGYMFIEHKRYKKYLNCNGNFYLVED